MSAANAALDHVRAFLNKTPDGDWFSAAVPSDGSYGIAEGLIFSFPLVSDGQGGYEIVQGLPISDFAREKSTPPKPNCSTKNPLWLICYLDDRRWTADDGPSSTVRRPPLI
jgi:hypothetical protein